VSEVPPKSGEVALNGYSPLGRGEFTKSISQLRQTCDTWTTPDCSASLKKFVSRNRQAIRPSSSHNHSQLKVDVQIFLNRTAAHA
jgi:hypothetical protein